MNRYGNMDRWSWTTQREATWNAIGSSGYFAPARIAMDEVQAQTLTEAAQARLLSDTTHARHRSGAGEGTSIRLAWVMDLGRWLKRRLTSSSLTNQGPASSPVPRLP